MLEYLIEPKFGGMILILRNVNENEYIVPESVELHGEILRSGDLTTLDGIYERPVVYSGFHYKTNGNAVMCFEIGRENDLFDTVIYYNCWYRITGERIVNKFSKNSARDYIWTGTKWK